MDARTIQFKSWKPSGSTRRQPDIPGFVEEQNGPALAVCPKRIFVARGRPDLSASISDASGNIPAKGEVPAYFAVTGTPNGGRNDIRSKMTFTGDFGRDPPSPGRRTANERPGSHQFRQKPGRRFSWFCLLLLVAFVLVKGFQPARSRLESLSLIQKAAAASTPQTVQPLRTRITASSTFESNQ